ncbi:MAG TPA: hypothetical protein VIV06_12425 [Candidatus Limnocylindrales bacterium]
MLRRPGEQLFFDTFYLGQLKGVGRVWQLNAVEDTSSFGIARVIAGGKTAAVMAAFLLDDVVPARRGAGLGLHTATTDNGPGRLPLPLLHERRDDRRRPAGLAALRQLRAVAPRLPNPGPDVCEHLLWRSAQVLQLMGA